MGLVMICRDFKSGAYIGLVMPDATAWVYALIPNSSIEKCEKYRHLKYVKTSAYKNTSFEKLINKYFSVFCFRCVIL